MQAVRASLASHGHAPSGCALRGLRGVGEQEAQVLHPSFHAVDHSLGHGPRRLAALAALAARATRTQGRLVLCRRRVYNVLDYTGCSAVCAALRRVGEKSVEARKAWPYMEGMAVYGRHWVAVGVGVHTF